MERIPESYIHYLWQYRLYRQGELQTTEGQALEVIRPGYPHQDAGPDFSQARIRIDDEEWAGSVEIHYRSSDWLQHGHHHDKAYDNVILHVVIHHDKEIRNSHGNPIPTLTLGPYLDKDHFKEYERFIQARTWVPCEEHARSVDEFKWLKLKESLAFERCQRKSELMLQGLKEVSNDWEELCYRELAKAMGAKVNTMPFQLLAERTPMVILRKHRDNETQLESLMLGQAGFLEGQELFREEYEENLRAEYRFLRQKYDLSPMKAQSWKNARIRPSSAPQVRIAQLARLLSRTDSLHSKFIDTDRTELDAMLSVTLTGYWEDHIAVSRTSSKRKKSIGASLKDRILINVVAPLRFAYGMYIDEHGYRESAISLLVDLASEDNSIIRNWSKRGVKASNAMDSQALIELKTQRCDKKKCLSCAIGQEILRGNESLVRGNIDSP